MSFALLFPFHLPPWWCVMFPRGDNRCHGETPLVSALWGTLMTHTHTHAPRHIISHGSTRSSFSRPWEPQMTLHYSPLSLALPIYVFLLYFLFPSLYFNLIHTFMCLILIIILTTVHFSLFFMTIIHTP